MFCAQAQEEAAIIPAWAPARPVNKGPLERPQVRSAVSAAARGAADLVIDAYFQLSGSRVLLPVAEW